MELRHLRYFLAVAEEANFTRAALRVGIGQPPLSQQIRALERELGADLFRRLPHGVELTEAGRALLPEARATLAQAERAASTVRRAAKGQIGHLRLGLTGSTAFCPLVPQAIRDFRRRYGAVDLSIEEASTTRLLQRIEGEELDAAFVRVGEEGPRGIRLDPLAREPMLVVLPSDHVLAAHETVPLASLAGEPLVLFDRSEGEAFFDEIVAACRAAGFEPTLGPTAPQITSVANLVAAGLGVSLVPVSSARPAVPGVAVRSLSGSSPTASLALATRSGDASAIVRNLVAVCRSAAAAIEAAGHRPPFG